MKKRIILGALLILSLTGCSKNVIKEKDFEKGLKNYIESSVNDSEYEATVKDGQMNVIYYDKQYELSYNLEKNPTIVYTTTIKSGISYEDYSIKTEGLSLPMLGYFAISNVYGVEPTDAVAYFQMSYISGLFSSADEDQEIYIVTDFPEDYEDNENIILTEEFGDKVIEYVKNSYGQAVEFEDEHKTYTYTLSSSCTEKSCDITSTLTINEEADWTNLNGYADDLAKEYMDESITPETADYNIELVVGQSITVSGNTLDGYDISGMDIVEIEQEDNNYIFKATREGEANGNFYLGEDSRTFYVTVTESKNNTAKDKTLTIK